ncbi:MAG: Cyanophycin synthetase [Parcubacteria group bacterium]|nr:Cyanophycin synthetase [Parcubacteria group bacterium]
MNVPKAKPCAECGGDPVFHGMTYYTILIDDAMRKVMDPGFVGKFFGVFASALERGITPHVLDFMMRTGMANKREEPDDETQLLALMIWNEAKVRGIKVTEFRLFDLPRNIFLAELPSGKKLAYEGIPLPARAINRAEWLDNKAEMKKKFTKLGLPVAKGGSASSWREARKLYRTLAPPVIVKPYSGSGSRHTLLHIEDETELKRAFDIAKQICPAAVIEEELVGPVYRATVVDEKLAATLRRDQPHVIGDGVRTITELVAEANKHPGRSGPYFHQMNLDADAEKELAWQKMTFTSIPENGLRVTLNQKINWGVGGTTADVSDDVHPDNVELFEEVARVLKAPIVGIDFIIPDITRSWKEQDRCGVIECNSMPFFDNHHLPFEGKPRNVASLIWQMVLRSL